jgi:hypothetical protein
MPLATVHRRAVRPVRQRQLPRFIPEFRADEAHRSTPRPTAESRRRRNKPAGAEKPCIMFDIALYDIQM